MLARLKEKSQKSGFEDIHFLAGDEDLDFNIGHGGDVEEIETKNSEAKHPKSTNEVKQKTEVKRVSKKDIKSEAGRTPKQEALAHVCDGDEDTDNDDSSDEESGSAKKTHAKTNKKPYQKYIKHHDEDMESTLL